MSMPPYSQHPGLISRQRFGTLCVITCMIVGIVLVFAFCHTIMSLKKASVLRRFVSLIYLKFRLLETSRKRMVKPVKLREVLSSENGADRFP